MHKQLTTYSPHNQHGQRLMRRGQGCPPRAGFTLIEMMVALAILMLMMTIIFVPLNMSINFFHIGNSRANIQQAAQLSLNKIESDLHAAVFVYPNDVLPGVTNQGPYQSTGNAGGAPYYQSTDNTITDTWNHATNAVQNIVCGANTRVGNTSRLDFVLPQRTNGVPDTPLSPEHYIVTYYARRFDPTQAYDAADNPIGLFRAQIPYQYWDTTTNATTSPHYKDFPAPDMASAKNADTTGARYPATAACDTNANRASLWLAQTFFGEPDLELVCNDANSSPGAGPTVVAAHELITPRNMALLAPHALDDKLSTPSPNTLSYIPETTFVCLDTNGDGKIDRVRVTIALGQYDEAGAVSTPQNVRLSQDIDLPNIQ